MLNLQAVSKDYGGDSGCCAPDCGPKNEDCCLGDSRSPSCNCNAATSMNKPCSCVLFNNYRRAFANQLYLLIVSALLLIAFAYHTFGVEVRVTCLADESNAAVLTASNETLNVSDQFYVINWMIMISCVCQFTLSILFLTNACAVLGQCSFVLQVVLWTFGSIVFLLMHVFRFTHYGSVCSGDKLTGTEGPDLLKNYLIRRGALLVVAIVLIWFFIIVAILINIIWCCCCKSTIATKEDKLKEAQSEGRQDDGQCHASDG